MSLKEIKGLPILNAKKSITIHVNKNDIDKADAKEPQDCAVARACRRELHAQEVRVHLGRVYIRTNAGSWTRYLTPKAMRQEIIAFDRGGTFEPGEFVLSPVPPSKKTGKRYGGKDKYKHARNNPNTKKRKPPTIVTNVRIGPA